MADDIDLMRFEDDGGPAAEPVASPEPPDLDHSACSLCRAEKVWVRCWQCHGDGGFHDCGEDCCCCADPDDDLNEPCGECNGLGGYLECPFVGPGHGGHDPDLGGEG